MIINKIKLENIRSYVNNEISFPEGSVLLSGDIGSGKSSVLFAVEFALFGLEKGGGSKLLRSGQDKGSVELYFEIEGKEVILKRSLKRGSKSVNQGEGYLIINGKKEEGTATELKAKVLDLLNYPKDYLTKSKGLIYKYTVYTPQEEMKRILMENKDERLHVLRKVFDIDKYKRVQENSSLFLKYLRGENRIHEERLRDLDVKLNEKKQKERERGESREELGKIEGELREIKLKVKGKKFDIEKFETRLEEYNELKSQLNNLEIHHANNLNEKNRIENRIKELSEEMVEEENIDFEDAKKEYDFKIDAVRKNISEFENRLEETRGKLSGFKAKEDHACEIKDKVKDLDKCPTCFQEVKQGYKETIFNNQDELVKKIKEDVEVLIKIEEEYKTSLMRNREKLELFMKKKSELDLKELKIKNLVKKKEEIEVNKEEMKISGANLYKLDLEKKKLDKKLVPLHDVNKEEYDVLKLELDQVLNKERELEVKESGVKEKINFFNESIEKLQLEILELEKLQLKLSKVKGIEDWLDKHFLNLMGVIEKSVMFKLHKEFNDLFKKWFDVIIENENLNVELDEEFTPLITQDGYNLDYGDLSGGERTAVALAYRLSLNQVINNLIGEVKTKDLLILDEPTEGFSTEQLDRVRVVLDELEIKQIIIVSHEAKVESFVDKILRFEKKNGISEISE